MLNCLLELYLRRLLLGNFRQARRDRALTRAQQQKLYVCQDPGCCPLWLFSALVAASAVLGIGLLMGVFPDSVVYQLLFTGGMQ